MASSLSLYSPGDLRRRLGGEVVAGAPLAPPLADADMPRWAQPLHLQPDRPSSAAISAYQRSLAAERALSVPHGINILQQAAEVAHGPHAVALAAYCVRPYEAQQPIPDMIHCTSCEAPYEAYDTECPYCHYGR